MKKTIAFTIVAQNYIGLAIILRESVQRQHTDVDFIIFVSDECDDAPQGVVPVHTLGFYGEDEWCDMAFKYDLTEFCTAIKPACFEFLFGKGYDQALYFDPDIYVFSPLNEILSALETHDMVLTPQVAGIHVDYTGEHPEWAMNVNGIFNLGFCGIRNGEKGRQILSWWKRRLMDNAFADRAVGNFTDQKWMDWIPAFLGDRLYVSLSLGTNMAPWNYFERRLTNEGGVLYVTDRTGDDPSRHDRLVFLHFAGYDYAQLKRGIVQRKRITNLQEYPDLNLATDLYRDEIVRLRDVFDHYIDRPYTYATFDNGDVIQSFHRRLYHGFSGTETNADFSQNPFKNPFSTGEGTLHARLKARRMIHAEHLDRLNQRNLPDMDGKRRMLGRFFCLLFRLMGYKRYVLFVKSLYNYCRPEWHTFLLKK